MKRIFGDAKESSWTYLRLLDLGSTFTCDEGKTIYLRGQSVGVGESNTLYITRLVTGDVEIVSGDTKVEPYACVFMEEELVTQFGIRQSRVA